MSHSLSRVLTEAQRSLLLGERIQSELLKLAQYFLRDDEINDQNEVSASAMEGVLSLEELIGRHAAKGLKITRLGKAGHIEVSGEIAPAFVQALLRPIAIEVARLGFQEAPLEADDDDSDESDDSDEMRQVWEDARQPVWGIFGRTIEDSLDESISDSLAGGEARLDAQAATIRALEEAVSRLSEYGPTDMRWRAQLRGFEETAAKLVQEAFMPPERAAADLFAPLVVSVREAFKLLGEEPGKDLVYAYVGKLTALAGLSLPRKDDASHGSRVRRALERRARKDDSQD